MKREEWLEFREKLKKIPPVTRINYLQEFLQKEKNKDIRNEIRVEIRDTETEIREQAIEGRTSKATVTTVAPGAGAGAGKAIETPVVAEQETLEEQEIKEQTLEDTVEAMPIEEKEEEKKPKTYGAKEHYKTPEAAAKSIYAKEEKKLGKGISPAVTPEDWATSEEKRLAGEKKEFSPAEEYISEVTTPEGASSGESFKSEDSLEKIRKYEKGETEK